MIYSVRALGVFALLWSVSHAVKMNDADLSIESAVRTILETSGKWLQNEKEWPLSHKQEAYLFDQTKGGSNFWHHLVQELGKVHPTLHPRRILYRVVDKVRNKHPKLLGFVEKLKYKLISKPIFHVPQLMSLLREAKTIPLQNVEKKIWREPRFGRYYKWQTCEWKLYQTLYTDVLQYSIDWIHPLDIYPSKRTEGIDLSTLEKATFYNETKKKQTLPALELKLRTQDRPYKLRFKNEQLRTDFWNLLCTLSEECQIVQQRMDEQREIAETKKLWIQWETEPLARKKDETKSAHILRNFERELNTLKSPNYLGPYVFVVRSQSSTAGKNIWVKDYFRDLFPCTINNKGEKDYDFSSFEKSKTGFIAYVQELQNWEEANGYDNKYFTCFEDNKNKKQLQKNYHHWMAKFIDAIQNDLSELLTREDAQFIPDTVRGLHKMFTDRIQEWKRHYLLTDTQVAAYELKLRDLLQSMFYFVLQNRNRRPDSGCVSWCITQLRAKYVPPGIKYEVRKLYAPQWRIDGMPKRPEGGYGQEPLARRFPDISAKNWVDLHQRLHRPIDRMLAMKRQSKAKHLSGAEEKVDESDRPAPTGQPVMRPSCIGRPSWASHESAAALSSAGAASNSESEDLNPGEPEAAASKPKPASSDANMQMKDVEKLDFDGLVAKAEELGIRVRPTWKSMKLRKELLKRISKKLLSLSMSPNRRRLLRVRLDSAESSM